jgi:uncharacterized membrane protein YccC
MTTRKQPRTTTKDGAEQQESLATHAAQLPAPPQRLAPLGRQEAAALNKLGDDETERAQVALDELVKKGDTLQKQLGGDVPDSAAVQQVRDDLAATEQGLHRAQELLDYWQQQNLVARHAAVKALQEVHRELQHRAEKHPELLAGYETTERFFEKRSEAIIEGRRLAREDKKTPPKG